MPMVPGPSLERNARTYIVTKRIAGYSIPRHKRPFLNTARQVFKTRPIGGQNSRSTGSCRNLAAATLTGRTRPHQRRSHARRVEARALVLRLIGRPEVVIGGARHLHHLDAGAGLDRVCATQKNVREVHKHEVTLARRVPALFSEQPRAIVQHTFSYSGRRARRRALDARRVARG